MIILIMNFRNGGLAVRASPTLLLGIARTPVTGQKNHPVRERPHAPPRAPGMIHRARPREPPVFTTRATPLRL